MEQKQKKLPAEFIANEGTDFIIKDNRIVLSPSFIKNNKFKFSKITATKLYSIVKPSDLNSPVKTWAQMVKIYREDMDKMVSDVGTIMEPKIREFVQNYLKYTTKQDFFYKEYIPREVKWDVFPENKVFGGIPDGEPIINGKIDYSTGIPLLEIKTCSVDAFLYKKEGPLFVLQKDPITNDPVVKRNGAGEKKKKWIENGVKDVPEEYQYQIGMYLYLRNLTKGLICCYLIDTKDYQHPEKIEKIDPEKLVACYVSIDRDEYKKVLDKAEKWYNDYILTGVSPELTEKDKQWIKEVKTLKQNQ